MPWNIILIFALIGFIIGIRRGNQDTKLRDEEEAAEYINDL